ncbi:MAG: hypothetical protein RL150_541 [Candidatus Parcubacteria bacterium]|jgi:sugar-specific transcriptional regulator TrmB
MADKITKADIKRRLIDDMGFSEKKALVYLTLLELGEVPAADIAKRAGIKRTTVYNILPELLREGLIKKYRSNKKTLYFVEDTTSLLDRMHERTLGIERIIPTLHLLQSATTVRPKITHYEGRDGIMNLYLDMIANLGPREELLSVVGTQNYLELMPTHVLEDYSRKRIAQGGPHRMIAGDSEFIRQFKYNDSDKTRQIKILQSADSAFDAEVRIFNNRVALISPKENFLGMIIESADLYKLHKMLFERLWSELK